MSRLVSASVRFRLALVIAHSKDSSPAVWDRTPRTAITLRLAVRPAGHLLSDGAVRWGHPRSPTPTADRIQSVPPTLREALPGWHRLALDGWHRLAFCRPDQCQPPGSRERTAGRLRQAIRLVAPFGEGQAQAVPTALRASPIGATHLMRGVAWVAPFGERMYQARSVPPTWFPRADGRAIVADDSMGGTV